MMLASLINAHEVAADEMTLRYFEAGHTFMSADSVHHGVEEQMRRMSGGNMCDFSDYVDCIRQSNGKAMKIIEIQISMTTLRMFRESKLRGI